MTLSVVERVEQVAELEPMSDFLADLRLRRDEIEAARRLPPPVLRGLVDAGLARLCVPRRFGGDEIDPLGFMRTVEEVARADASTAWCLWIYSSAPWFLSHAAESAAWGVYADGPDVLVASPLAPKGVAVPTAGGYRLTGRWPFASGSNGADWFVCRARLAGGAPDATRLMLVPSASVQRLDTWWSSGLCGTGSGDVAVDDLFVPELHAIDFDHGARRWPERLFAYPHRSLACVSAVIALGIAREALDDFVDLAQGKTAALGSGRLAESPLVQVKVARAEAELGAARAFLYEAAENVWDAARVTGSVSARYQALLRAAANHACRSASGVVGTVYGAAGSTSVHRSSPLQRHLRDVHAVAQHFFHCDDVDRQAGSVLLGVDEAGPSRL